MLAACTQALRPSPRSARHSRTSRLAACASAPFDAAARARRRASSSRASWATTSNRPAAAAAARALASAASIASTLARCFERSAILGFSVPSSEPPSQVQAEGLELVPWEPSAPSVLSSITHCDAYNTGTRAKCGALAQPFSSSLVAIAPGLLIRWSQLAFKMVEPRPVFNVYAERRFGPEILNHLGTQQVLEGSAYRPQMRLWLERRCTRTR